VAKEQTVNREELAWAGGFFSGEGCSRVNTTRTTKKFVRPRDYHRTQLSLVQTTDDGEIPEALQRFWDAILGLGNITGPYKKRHQNGRDYYTWSATKFVEVQAIIAMLWPWLSTIKQKQAARSLRTALASASVAPYRRGKGGRFEAVPQIST
jgi:hypothetical protein